MNTGKDKRIVACRDDGCFHGNLAIMKSESITFPANFGSEETALINQLVDIVEDIAGVKLNRQYNLDAPKGVNGRNSENTLIRKMLGWEPRIPRRDGWEKTTLGFTTRLRVATERQPSSADTALEPTTRTSRKVLTTIEIETIAGH
jgi:nucleoside-diphosphate-sugar epimerase